MAGLFDDVLEPSSSDASGLFDDILKPKPIEGGLIAAAKSGFGSAVKGAGQAAGDFIPGVSNDNALKRYGQGVIDANPTAVRGFDDLYNKPWTAIKEAIGNAGGSVGQIVAARAIGQGITAAAPLTGPLAPVTAAVGQAIAWFGPAAIAALPSYGSIRDKQILNDPASNEDWKSKAIATLGAGAVGAIEAKFGPQEWALGAMSREGRAKLAEKFAETTLAKGIGFGALKGAAIEGAEELVQNPIEQLASYEDPTSSASLKETAFGGVMGAIGGGVLGGATGAVFRSQPLAAPDRTADIVNAPGLDEAIVISQQALDEVSAPLLSSGFDLLSGQATNPLQEAMSRPAGERIAAPTNTQPAELLERQLIGANPMLDMARAREDRAAADAAIRQAEEARVQSELDAIPAIAADQNIVQSAVQRAATLEAPTALELAFQRAKQEPTQAPAPLEPATPEAPTEPVAEPPRLIDRAPGLLPMSLARAEQVAAKSPDMEVVRFPNINRDTGQPNGKFSYTVITKETDGTTGSVRAVDSGADGGGGNQPGPSVLPGSGNTGAAAPAVDAGSAGSVLPRGSVPAVPAGVAGGLVGAVAPGEAGLKQGAKSAAQQPPAPGREGYDTPVQLDAASLKSIIEQTRGEPLADKPAKLEAWRNGTAKTDKSKFPIELSFRPDGQLDVNDGRHRIALAAERGETVTAFIDGHDAQRAKELVSQPSQTPAQSLHAPVPAAGQPAAGSAGAQADGIIQKSGAKDGNQTPGLRDQDLRPTNPEAGSAEGEAVDARIKWSDEAGAKPDSAQAAGVAANYDAPNYVWAQKDIGYAPMRPNDRPYILASKSGSVGVATPFGAKAKINDTVQYFATPEAAEQWAKVNGYEAGSNPYVKPQKEPNEQTGSVAPLPDKRLIPVSKRVAPVAPDNGHIGANNIPIAEGGKPFKTKKGADLARKMNPMLRAKQVQGGYVLAPKTEKQLAAEAIRVKRLSQPRTSPPGEPIPAHAFIASEGGLSKTHQNDLGVDGNPKIGNRWLFSALGRGLSIEQATELLKENQYLPADASHTDAYNLIRKSLTQPQYNADGIERIAQAEQAARFDDYLTAQMEDAPADPFGDLDDLDITVEDATVSGYDELSDPIKIEVNALLAQADALGIDTDTIKEEAYEATRNGSEQDYFEAQRSQLQAAIDQGNGGLSDQTDPRADSEQGRETAVGQGGADRGADTGQQGGAAEPILTAPTRGDILAQQDRAEATEKQNTSQRMAAEKQAAQDEDRKRIAKASEAAASTFTLGGDAMDNLTGQGSIFDAPAEEPASDIKPITPDAAANMQRGDIVRDSNGVEYYAWSARFSRLDVVPMENGKPIVYSGSTIRFALNQTTRDANPEYRSDDLYLVRKAEQEPAKPAAEMSASELLRAAADKMDAEKAAAEVAQPAPDAAKPENQGAGKDAAEPNQPIVSPDDFPLSDADRSYDGISHHGRSRAKADQEQFVKSIQGEYDAAATLAETPEQQTVLASETKALKADYISRYRVLMNVRANTYSAFVAGRSGLNAKQANRGNDALTRANDVFDAWRKEATGRIKTAVLNARNAAQLAAVQDAKDAKAAEKERRDLELIGKLMAFKSGDDLRFGAAIVTRVSMDKEGYPNTLTIKDAKGEPLMDDKISVAKVFGGKGPSNIQQGKQEIRRLVDLFRSGEKPPQSEAASQSATNDKPSTDADRVFATKQEAEQALWERINAGTLIRGQDLLQAVRETVNQGMPGNLNGLLYGQAQNPAPSTPIATIRESLTKAYGKLSSRLESKGLLSIHQTQGEAMQAAALARSDARGTDLETELAGLQDGGTNQSMTNSDVVGNQGGRSADDTIPGVTLYHGSPESGMTVVHGKSSSLFGGVFASATAQAAESHGDNLYKTELPESAILTQQKLDFDIPVDEIKAALKQSMYGLSDEDVDVAYQAVIDDQSNRVDDDELMRIFKEDDVGAASWEAQRIRGQVAKRLGFQAVAMNDEHGISYLLLPGVKLQPNESPAPTIDGALDLKRSADGRTQGFYDPITAKSFLIADNLTSDTAPGVLIHEIGIHAAADGTMDPLHQRAADLVSGDASDFMRDVANRMDAAGETSAEEAAAYIAEAYENNRLTAPKSVRQWIADYIAAIRGWLYKKGILIASSDLTPADIAAIARANARAVAEGGAQAGEGGLSLSESGEALSPGADFWRKIKAGEAFTDKELEDAYSKGRRGSERAVSRMDRTTPEGARNPGEEVATWSGTIAGFDGYKTVGVTTEDGTFIVGVIPEEIFRGSDSGSVRETAIVTYEFTPVGDKYRLDVGDPMPTGDAFAEMQDRGTLESTGKRDEDGQLYFRAKLESRYTTSRALLQEAVRRLALHIGKAPEIFQSVRETGARAGLPEYRGYSADQVAMKFSRAAIGELKQQAQSVYNAAANTPGKLGWWHKTVGTQYNLAQRSPEFKRVYDAVQSFLNDVSFFATESADLAPTILPKLENWRDIAKSPLSAADTKAIAAPIFEGTLTWMRDESGKPVKVAGMEEQAQALTSEQKAQRLLRNNKISANVLKMWKGMEADKYDAAVSSKYENDMLKAGIVWTDQELTSLFNLNADQISLYREFRKATDKSLTALAMSDMLYVAGDDAEPIRDAVLASATPMEAAETIQKYLLSVAEYTPDRNDELLATADTMIDKAAKVQDLIDRGYAPLSRFGNYTLDVVDDTGERVYFGLFEGRFEAEQMAKKMREMHPGANVTQGTLSEQSYKLFSGVSPETVALFGGMMGLDGNPAYQEYIKLAKSSRSALKRLIERKGIAGFSEDAGRVLAGFVYSNARQTSQNLHAGEMSDAANAIPQQQGELKDHAVNLVEYIKNPQQEAQQIRGLLFAQYIGGSVASAMVNMTQPLTMTLPWLSQYGGITKAAKQMAAAVVDANKKTTGDTALDAALKRAEEDGTVSPQEVHDLMRQAQGKGALQSGDGSAAGDAYAKSSNMLSLVSFAWGKLFSAAEQFNRRSTFIAAYRTAVEQGLGDPSKFAEQAIAETQGIYNKGNKPEWARGSVGSILFTFKQYSIAYVEMLSRMATAGKPGSPERAAGQRSALYALGVLMLLSGAGGLPGADDLDDLISGLMQALGYNFDSKSKRKAFLVEHLGTGGADFVERGLSGLPGAPIDVSGRLGLGNLIPGTGLLTKKQDHTRDVLEFVGPAGDLFKRGFESAGKVVTGDIMGKNGAVATLAPKAMQNLFQAADMEQMGMYRDQTGKKVIDTDSGDALAKALGFQPGSVKRSQDASFEVQRMVGLNKINESRIVDKWAQGLFEKDPEKVQEARDELAQWNKNNPESPIRVKSQQIFSRVANMRMTKQQRIAKTAPAEIRREVYRELAQQ